MTTPTTAPPSREAEIAARLEKAEEHGLWKGYESANILADLRYLLTQLQQARSALKENRDEIRQQAGKHYTGCNCTFCSVIARTDAALQDEGR